ncbi:MAG: cation diffusion facilitator family transporter [Halofilum sp. (in: g-proteobacteria)]|nr:cation diffusion facilitator family transporter [Halofilum sp. (in: g-proteobacteria)]
MASDSKVVIHAALVGNALIAVTKFIAAAITGSSAMLAEGIHSVVDTGNQVLLLFGLRRAKRPPDARFPFGHGKEIYFWSFVVAILIFAVGAGISLYEGIHAVLDPHPVTNPAINYVVLGLAIVFEGAAWWFAWRGFRAAKGSLGYVEAVVRSKDPTLFVVLFEDSAALLGLVVALAGIATAQATGAWWLDGAASMVIGCILAATAVWLAVETKGLLIGEAASPAVIRDLRERIAAHDCVRAVNEVLTLHMGPEYILVNASVTFDPGARAERVAAAVAAIDHDLRTSWPEVRRVFIEGEGRQGSEQPVG